jgi:hypothetical protein
LKLRQGKGGKGEGKREGEKEGGRQGGIERDIYRERKRESPVSLRPRVLIRGVVLLVSTTDSLS